MYATKLIIDTWVSATWDEYLQHIERPDCQKAKGYYYDGRYRIEMTLIGNDHSQDHSIINHAIYLYATLNLFIRYSYKYSSKWLLIFKIENQVSRRISESIVLPRLKIELLTEALRRSRHNNHTEVSTWLLQKFQSTDKSN
ncbi:hypothetical protein [Myxosarcina sp. GI1(2024)]